MNKKNNKITKYKKLSIGAIILIIVFAIFGGYQISKFDDGIFEIYANQQDAYVQLVLDQINIQGDKSDEQIITEILGSLDASNSKYWTLSKEQALLFVKNVTETNRYKGFTTATYFVSDSAEEFLQSLTVNRVVHRTITMEEDRYVASGVVFEYNGSQYKICLLTNETVIVDSNTYLSAKITVYIYVAFILIVLLISVMIFTSLLDAKSKQIEDFIEKTEVQNKNIEMLEEKVKAMNYYQTRWSLFNGNLMDKFVANLSKKDVYPITFVKVSFEHKANMKAFLEKAQLMLDEKVLRFATGRREVSLIFVQYTVDEAKKALVKSAVTGMKAEKVVLHEDNTVSVSDAYDKFKEKENEE